MNTQHDEVATVLSTWTAAEMSGDANTIGELLADDFTAFGPLGFALSKKDWLERHKAGALEYETFALEELEFRRYDGVAVATARETGTCTYNGHPVPGELRVTIVLTDQAGAWQLALIHMSFIAGTPVPPRSQGDRVLLPGRSTATRGAVRRAPCRERRAWPETGGRRRSDDKRLRLKETARKMNTPEESVRMVLQTAVRPTQQRLRRPATFRNHAAEQKGLRGGAARPMKRTRPDPKSV
jgi:ketosteroid isomerase-like protein